MKLKGTSAARLIGRIKRTKSGDGFQRVISDVMRAFASGDISSDDVKSINRAADAQLRQWNADIRAAESELRAMLRTRENHDRA